MKRRKKHHVPGLALQVTLSSVIRGTTAITSGVVGHRRKEDLSPPLQVSGEGLQPMSSVLHGCLGLPFSTNRLKPSSPATRKQRGKQ